MWSITGVPSTNYQNEIKFLFHQLVHSILSFLMSASQFVRGRGNISDRKERIVSCINPKVSVLIISTLAHKKLLIIYSSLLIKEVCKIQQHEEYLCIKTRNWEEKRKWCVYQHRTHHFIVYINKCVCYLIFNLYIYNGFAESSWDIRVYKSILKRGRTNSVQ